MEAIPNLDAISDQLSEITGSLLPPKVVHVIVNEPQVIVGPEAPEGRWWTRWQLPDPGPAATIVPAQVVRIIRSGKSRLPGNKGRDFLSGHHVKDFAKAKEFDKYTFALPHVPQVRSLGFFL